MSSEDIYEDMEPSKKNLAVSEKEKAVTAPDNDEGNFPVPEKVFYITTPGNEKSNEESGSDKKLKIAIITLFLTMIVLIMSVVVTWIAIAVEMNQLKFETASLRNRMQQPNTLTENIIQLLTNDVQELNASLDEILSFQHASQNYSALESIIQLLTSDVQELNASLEISFQHASQNYSAFGSIIQLLIQASFETFLQQFSSLESITQLLTNNVQELNTAFEQILQHVNGSNSTALVGKIQLLRDFLIVPSCGSLPPYSPSGYYLVRASDGSVVRVYCDMTRSCGGVTGGWIRVAYLDMRNSSHQCPIDLSQFTVSNIRTCALYSISSGSCSSVLYGSQGIHYSQVCGKIRGYQILTPDGFDYRSSSATIDSNYADGISLTHGIFPRHHIWTFATHQACGCGNPPPFINNDYFCDGNTPGLDPIWDGEGCPSTCSNCTFNNPPWFHRQLPQSTTDEIEMRLCRDEGRTNEDALIEAVEIYVQ